MAVVMVVGRARRSLGLTLVELLVVLGVAGILLAVAVPALAGVVHAARLTALTNDMLAELNLARSEAIRRGQRVALCKAASAASCTLSGDWGQGWLMFADTNNNGWRDAGEPVLRYRAAAAAGWRIVGNSPVANYVSYHPLGRTLRVSGAFQAGTLTVCRRASLGAGQARQIVINSTGRVRSQVAQSVPPACA